MKDIRDYDCQVDTGYANGCKLTEVQGPQNHRKPLGKVPRIFDIEVCGLCAFCQETACDDCVVSCGQ